ncbi:MAG: PfkB family carbohydrate kinase [Thermoleophilia bacterium]|nr:PfkB family carbohydrate kinase [Thermoleophilia bacterium]
MRLADLNMDTPRDHRANVCVFAPSLFVTVTIEGSHGRVGDEIHFHPGGQGFWIARMLRHLGERPVLCGPVGGESGKVLRGLMAQWGVEFAPVPMTQDTPAYVHDRREGERLEVAASALPALNRHELDDLYGRTLERALASGLVVLAGRHPGHDVDLDIYERLGSDLGSAGVGVVADLHGLELDALIATASISVLKVSDDDLIEAGRLRDDTEAAALTAVADLRREGAESVVLSRAERPALAGFPEGLFRVHPPHMDTADPRGAGDSMTAGLVAGRLRDLSATDTLRLACAAGTANVARHGLGSATALLVDQLVKMVRLERLEPEPA